MRKHNYLSINEHQEANALFISALIGSLFLIFLYIEPFLSGARPSSNVKNLSEKEVQKVILVSIIDSTALIIPNLQDSSALKIVKLSKPIEKNGLADESIATESAVKKVPIKPSSNDPDNFFSFGSQSAVKNPNSVPFLGGGGGFRGRKETRSNSRPEIDLSSEKINQAYSQELGRIKLRQNALSLLPQITSNLDQEEKYECKIEGIRGINECTPKTSKTALIESMLKDSNINGECKIITLSYQRGMQSKNCEN